MKKLMNYPEEGLYGLKSVPSQAQRCLKIG